jgi:serine/threonine protein kinase
MCRYFALERYDATLEQFCEGIYRGPMPSDAQVLCQIVKGLLHLHKVNCSHGNLTPGTVLIASSQPVRMMIKLSEFELSKFGDQYDDSQAEWNDKDGNTVHRTAKRMKYSENFEDLVEEQDICQRKYWILDGTTDSNQHTPTPNQDIFSAGCICFYFLTRGVHPFGDDSSSILENIQKRNPVNLLKSNSFVYNLNRNKQILLVMSISQLYNKKKAYGNLPTSP